LEYLRNERGLTDETIKHFNLGYDKERNAVAIPAYKNGELINIKYRLIKPDKTKYLNERGTETWIFNEDGIQRGIKKGGVLIVEGEFDAMTAWQAGFHNVISPSSGKDSYGVWLELLDNIPKVYIAYDNDKGGKDTSIKLAERIGTEKCYEVNYPLNVKDANDFFKSRTREDFVKLLENAIPFYRYRFKSVGDIINDLRNDKDDSISTRFIPKVKIGKDWLVVISGKSNIGKSSVVLNIADDFTKQGIPTLVMPFERGIESMGRRFLQIKFNKTSQDFQNTEDREWDSIISDCVDLPVYFSTPKKEEIVDTIIKSKRIFDTRVVIVDHLDYVVRHVQGNREAEISNTLQSLKMVAEEYGIIMLVVTHIRKTDSPGSMIQKKPSIEDLKGSSSLYQDPECVVLLTGDETSLNVNVAKNKGEMKSQEYTFHPSTGKMIEKDDF